MLRLLKITGSSLEPDFTEGEFVVTGRFPFRCIRPEQVIVFRQPGYGLLIKRVAWVDRPNQSVWVSGSHPHSVDSRAFGLVHRRQIIGRVLWQIRRPRKATLPG